METGAPRSPRQKHPPRKFSHRPNSTPTRKTDPQDRKSADHTPTELDQNAFLMTSPRKKQPPAKPKRKKKELAPIIQSEQKKIWLAKQRLENRLQRLNKIKSEVNLPPNVVTIENGFSEKSTQPVDKLEVENNSPKNQIERAVIDTTARRFRPCARDFIIFRDYTQGRADLWKLAEIHELEYSTIWQIVRKVENWLADQTLYEISGLRVRATSRADFLAQEAIDAWQLSKRDEVTTTETDRAMKNGQVVDSTVQRRTSAGNPAFLAQARECLDMVLKIWGAYSPKQLEVKDTSAEDSQRVGGRSAIEALQIRAQAINEQMARLTVDGTAVPTEEEPPLETTE